MLHSFTTRTRLNLALSSWNMAETSGKKKSIDGITWSFSTFRNWLAVPRPGQLKQPQIIRLQSADLNINYSFLCRQCIFSRFSYEMRVRIWIYLSCFCIFIIFHYLPVLFIIIIILPVHALVFPSHVSVFLRNLSPSASRVCISHYSDISGFLGFSNRFLHISFAEAFPLLY